MSGERSQSRRGLLLAVSVGSVLVALAVLAFSAFAPLGWQGRLVVAVAGVGLLGNVPFAMREWSGRVRWGQRVSTRDGQTVVAFDRVPAYAAAWTTGWLTLVVLLASVLGALAGSPGGLLVGIPLGLLFGLPFVDSVLALARGAQVVADPERLTVQSWATRTSIGWEDVRSVELEKGRRGIDIVVRGWANAPSWEGRALPHTWPGRAHVPEGEVRIESRAVEPHTPLLFVALQDWAAEPTSRATLGTPEAERRLAPRAPDDVRGR